MHLRRLVWLKRVVQTSLCAHTLCELQQLVFFGDTLWGSLLCNFTVGGHLSPSGNFIDSRKEVVVEDSISYAQGCSKSVKKNPFFFFKEKGSTGQHITWFESFLCYMKHLLCVCVCVCSHGSEMQFFTGVYGKVLEATAASRLLCSVPRLSSAFLSLW